MSRSWPVPRIAKSIHVVGDMQGLTGYYAPRDSIVLADMARPAVPDVPHRVQVGDFVAGNAMAEYADSTDFMNALGTAPWYATIGNHDYQLVTAAEAAALMGMPAPNYSVDLGFCAVVAFFVPSWGSSALDDPYTADTAWLETELAKYPDKPVLVLAHPLFYGSIVGREGFWMKQAVDADVRAVLDAAPQVKAWVCGHSHNMVTDQIVMPVDMGTRVVHQINGSALGVTTPSNASDHLDRLCSVYLTVEPDRLEVRFRDHGAHQWVAGSVEQVRVWTIPF